MNLETTLYNKLMKYGEEKKGNVDEHRISSDTNKFVNVRKDIMKKKKLLGSQ